MTREEKNLKQRVYRRKTGNWDCKVYEKTFKGYIMRMYRNMKSRVAGVQRAKAHLYLGKELMTKELFYAIALASPELLVLHREYVKSNFDMKLAPSINRKDTSQGYTPENVEFITHSENSRLGARRKPV